MTDIDEAIDWRGAPVSCESCAQRDVARCALKHACMQDRYARRIDRFFDWNPQTANAHLTHPHFEVRAIAAKHADLFLLPPLLHDEDETVRWNAARRLPPRYCLQLRADPHREVRIRVAARLEGAAVAPMLSDPDYYVRLVVARRIAPALLLRLVNDPEPEVRRAAAARLEAVHLPRLILDADELVRREVAQRLPAGLLAQMRHDASWRVRLEVAQRGPAGLAATLADDPDPLVAEAARQRRALHHARAVP